MTSGFAQGTEFVFISSGYSVPVSPCMLKRIRL